MSRGALLLASAVALAEAAGAVGIVATSTHEQHKVATTVLALTAGLSFVAAGLVALRRRPENRTGVYLAAVGYLWFFAALGDAGNDTLWTAGAFVGNLMFVPFAALDPRQRRTSTATTAPISATVKTVPATSTTRSSVGER